MTRARVVGLAAAAAWWAVSCRELTTPTGILSISALTLPSPGLVVGDTMRDSLGFAVSMRVTAYDSDGNPVTPQPATALVVLDSLTHVVSGDRLVGDRVGTSSVVATVGQLQTQPVFVKVTLSPDSLGPADSTHHTRAYVLTAGDTALESAELAVRALHKDGPGSVSTVDAVIVQYAVAYAPPGMSGSGPTVSLRSGSLTSSRDTTDAGRAARVVRLHQTNRVNFALDSAVVNATASYRGQSIGTVTFTIVFQPE